MDRDYVKSSEFNLEQFALFIFFMNKYHKYKSKCFNKLSLILLIIPKEIALFVTNSIPTVHPCLPTLPRFFMEKIYFFANYVFLKSIINLRVIPPRLCHIEMTKDQIRNSKSGGHNAYWKFPMVAWLGKGGKEEGKGERTAAREQFTGCGGWAWISHVIINKDADHY